VLTLVSTPIGNLGDITFRAIQTLQEAQTILAEDTRVARNLLRLLEERYAISFGSKEFHSFHQHNQSRFLASIDPTFFQVPVVYMSDAGMPAISDPGAALVRYAQEHQIPYTIVPGANAALSAWVASGYEGHWTFFGFLPHKRGRQELLQQVLRHPYHAILYEAPHRLLKLLHEIAAIDPERELFLAKELTKRHEGFYKGTPQQLLRELGQEEVRGEWVVIVTPGRQERPAIDLDWLLKLDLPKREKAKLIGKITGESAKEIYRKLIDN